MNNNPKVLPHRITEGQISIIKEQVNKLFDILEPVLLSEKVKEIEKRDDMELSSLNRDLENISCSLEILLQRISF